ncbi:aKG-HExxH-type peptide beta-hydroxylase [Mesorhizobium sp. BHbdii]
MAQLYADARNTLTQEFVAAVATLPASDARTLGKALSWLNPEHLAELCLQPGAVARQKTLTAAASGRVIHTVDGQPVVAESSYLSDLLERSSNDLERLAIGGADPWLRIPFGEAIYFKDEDLAAEARPVVKEALAIVEGWRPALAAEIRMACRAVQFVRDPVAHPEKIISFSDNSVPGALYVSVWQGDRLIDPYDLADSLVHEHRHQKLYLLERLSPTVEPTDLTVVSPWRCDFPLNLKNRLAMISRRYAGT